MILDGGGILRGMSIDVGRGRLTVDIRRIDRRVLHDDYDASVR